MVQRKGKGKCWKVCPSRSFITYLLITSTRESNPLYRLTQWSNNFTLEEGILTSSISSALWFEFQCEGCGLTTTVPHNLIQSHSPSLLLKLNIYAKMFCEVEECIYRKVLLWREKTDLVPVSCAVDIFCLEDSVRGKSVLFLNLGTGLQDFI